MFISFEGLDGSGKTTQAQRLASWLRTSGREVVLLREPGGTRIGDAVRLILHDHANVDMDARTELLLYCASRAQLIAEQVYPRLGSGVIVLCDRFADSTLAYQGYGRGLDLAFLRALLGFATRGIYPDLTLFFDIEPGCAQERRMSSGGEVNRLDVEAIEFHHRVRAGYQALIALEPERWLTIDASDTPDQIASRVQDIVKGRLNISD
jgi:dTMP kinase